MKKSIKILFFIFLSYSCTDTKERDNVNFRVSFKNMTNTDIQVFGYSPQNQLEFQFSISSLSSGGAINYDSETFGGYVNGSDSIIIKFPNLMGYICDLKQNKNSQCFTNKNPFGGKPSFIDLGNNIYEFEITQEDFDNAFDLQ